MLFQRPTIKQEHIILLSLHVGGLNIQSILNCEVLKTKNENEKQRDVFGIILSVCGSRPALKYHQKKKEHKKKKINYVRRILSKETLMFSVCRFLCSVVFVFLIDVRRIDTGGGRDMIKGSVTNLSTIYCSGPPNC